MSEEDKPAKDGLLDMSAALPAGKLPPQLLRELLAKLPEHSKRVLTGPGVGEDTAVISFGATSLVAKSDPVTFATDLIGWYVVHVNANDIAASGATPKWFMPTVLLPENTATSAVEEIFTQLQDATESIGVDMIGGHTEITVDLPRPIIAGTMLGEVSASGAVSTAEANPGDSIILTKGIAIEGASLLARQFGSQAIATGVSQQTLNNAANFLFEPGISVLKDSKVATAAGTVTAMHDPTEGGLASALAELSEASGNGLLVEKDAVQVLPECQELCDALNADPWGLISSGALLITCTKESATSIISALTTEGIKSSVIGEITQPGDRALLKTGSGATAPLPTFERDEIARLFSLSE